MGDFIIKIIVSSLTVLAIFFFITWMLEYVI